MNKEQFAKFAQWLQTNKEAYSNLTPDELIQKLNKLAETEEGKAELSSLFEEYAQSVQMRKAGGKIEQLVKRFQSGGINVWGKAFRTHDEAAKIADRVLEGLNGGDRRTINQVEKTKYPNDINTIKNALKNLSGTRKVSWQDSYYPDDATTTLSHIADSLIRRGHNPSLVKKYARPDLIEYIRYDDPYKPPMEDDNDRVWDIREFLYPRSAPNAYYKTGGIIKNPFKTKK